MNARGHYGNGYSAAVGARVGSSLVHVLELKQRYENVRTDAVSILLRDLSSDGTVSSPDTNRWEASLRDGLSVRFQWYPSSGVLEVSITDRQPWPTSQVASVNRRYQAMLNRISPLLQTYQAVAVGAALLMPRERVGITLYHSVSDRADAVKQMAIDWDALYQTLAKEAGEIPYDPRQIDWSQRPPAVQKAREDEIAAWKAIDAAPAAEKPAAVKRAQDATERRGQLYAASFDPKKVAWWKSYADPLFKAWHRFKVDQLGGDRTFADSYISFAERFQTNWDVYEDWKKKLDNLRAEAKSRGFAVDAPKPADLPTTVWADAGSALERGAGAVGSGIGDVWNTLKYGVWGILGIGAIVAISSVASNLKTGRDPAEKYMEMIRMSRSGGRGRGSRALAAREQLALPEGG